MAQRTAVQVDKKTSIVPADIERNFVSLSATQFLKMMVAHDHKQGVDLELSV